MVDNLLACLGDPVKANLLLEIAEKKQATAKQLSEKYGEIPQTTLYRHLKKMLGDGVLKVAGENHIRGTVEKVYALGFDFEGKMQTMVETNDGPMYLQVFIRYILGITREFQEYAVTKGIDLASDGSGFSIAPFYATTEELTEAMLKIGEVIMKLRENQPGGERMLRNLCIITTPPKISEGETQHGKDH